MTNLPSTMTGIILTGHGDQDKLVLRHDIPVPVPNANEVLIKVFAAGINNTDINTRTAWYSKGSNETDDASWSGNPLTFPRIQGADVCGEIVQVGDNVNANRIGERVLIEPCLTDVNGKKLTTPWYFGSECDGGFAEYTLVSEKHAYNVNSTLSHAELASFPCSYSTAENMLTRANVQQGDRVLISGASGGVGSAAIQLATARGAHVTAITSDAKIDLIKRLGADIAITRHTKLVEALGTNSIDVVIDLVAGAQWSEFLDVLRPKGRYAVSGAIGGAIVNLDVRTLYLKDLSFYGCTVLEPEVFSNLITLIEQGNISPLVANTFQLKDIKQAQSEFLQKKHIGKLILTIT